MTASGKDYLELGTFEIQHEINHLFIALLESFSYELEEANYINTCHLHFSPFF